MSTELHRPIFTQEKLDAYLHEHAPYVCNGRCVEIKAEKERQQREWDALPPEEKEKRIAAQKAETEKVLALFEGIMTAMRKANDTRAGKAAGQSQSS